MAALDFERIYALQDRVLASMRDMESSFYLTGGTCLNRFYLEKRRSEDLDFFTGDTSLFRDDVRRAIDKFRTDGLDPIITLDSRDFVRVLAGSGLQVDLVNDRVPRYGQTNRSPQGYRIDTLLNILTNKLTAILGRDEPKDIFDLYVIANVVPFNWGEMIEISASKSPVDREVLEYRLRSFPLELLDLLNVVDGDFLAAMKSDYKNLVEDITDERNNRFHE